MEKFAIVHINFLESCPECYFLYLSILLIEQIVSIVLTRPVELVLNIFKYKNYTIDTFLINSPLFPCLKACKLTSVEKLKFNNKKAFIYNHFITAFL